MSLKVSGHRVSGILIAALGIFCLLLATEYRASAVAVPPEGISIYMTTNVPSEGFNLGCEMGHIDRDRPGAQNTRVVLFFGAPRMVSGTYGASLWGGPNSTTATILEVVKEYARGYYNCTEDDVMSIAEIAIGTSNDGATVNAAHGQAWANMVNDFGSWLVSSGYTSQVDPAGAIDIEPGFGDPGPARDWVTGYDSAEMYRMFNVGSADGCPTDHIPTQNRVWNVGPSELGPSRHSLGLVGC